MATKATVKKAPAKTQTAVKQPAKRAASRDDGSAGQPAFPYTTEPQALKRLLAEIPKRPKPPKVNIDTLKGWKVSSSNNASTVLRVLKRIGLLQDSGQPTDDYVAYMVPSTGSAALGRKIQETYKVLFENSLTPQSAPTDELKTLFNIHSGGGEDAMRLQIQTFKILAEFASFGQTGQSTKSPDSDSLSASETGGSSKAMRMPPVQVDLHIHLPENKSSRDYEAIIQDIAKYIYGRDIDHV